MDELLERDEALATLSEALTEARLGQGRIVLVGGEAGAGKTMLVRAFCGKVDGGIRVLAGACDALSTPRPLGPLLDVASECDALVDAVRIGEQPADVFAALRDELAEQETVLVLEDLHWGDEATFDVLRLLTRRMDVPALVVATYRDDGLERDHPLRVLAGDLATASAVSRLSLGPLSSAAVAQLAIGHAIDPGALYERTGGNPFFVAQVLASGGAGVPQTVRDAVLARASSLDADALEVLEAVALGLPRTESWLLEAVVEDRISLVDQCVATGLVTWDDDAVAFRHELARAAVEDAMPPTRRIALQRRILAALCAAPEGDIDPARLAHHAEAARDVEAVLEFAPRAAVRACSTGAYREAAAQYARALRVGGTTLPPQRRAELLEGRSRACYLADDQIEAIAVVREALESRSEQGAPAHEARDLAELSSYLVCRGLMRDARDAMHEAGRLVEGQDESPEIAFVESYRSVMAYVDGEFDAGVKLAWRAREMAQRTGDHRTAVNSLVTAGTIELRRDRDAGLEIMQQALAEALAAGFSEQAARALNNLGAFGAIKPDLELADTYIPRALEFCLAHNEDLWRINILAIASRNALDRGRWTEASDFAEQLLQDPRESPWPHHDALIVLALVRARRGDPGAVAALDEAGAVDVPPEEIHAYVDLAAARAEVAWLEQRFDDVAVATEWTPDESVGGARGADLTRLAFWRSLSGLEIEAQSGAPEPYALALAGEWEQAAAAWERSFCPYEAALALLESNDEGSLRKALATFQELGALPAAQLATRRLRALGAKGVT